MSRTKIKLEYIPILLDQIAANSDRISKLVADAASDESLEAVKPEVEKITSRNKTLLNLVATLIDEVKKYPPGTVPPISPVRFY